MKSNHCPKDKDQQLPSPQDWLIFAGIILVGVGVIVYLSLSNQEPGELASSLATVAQAVTAGEVKSLTVRGDLLMARKVDGTSLSAIKESSLSALETLQLLGVPAEALAKVPLEVEETNNPLVNFICMWLPMVVLVILGYCLFHFGLPRSGYGPGDPLQRLGRSHPRVLSGTADKDTPEEHPQVTFQDVAGIDQAKVELQEVVEFLKEPAKFARLGARVPRGVLMAGPPGTGKTLLAKAVAGEAGVPFFTISGSEFVEMYVGLGAARVRDLFLRARDQAPAIIFVDEIDAVGRQRGVRLSSGNDEREQTLNQVLVEMDGFTTDTTVIVMAATNRPDILDPALLRPGRFDRKVFLDRPDVEERAAILKVHAQGKPLAPDIAIADLAKLTPGFVGADLENLVNEAAILAARRNLTWIGWPEFQDALERIVAGPERKGRLLSPQERQVVAYHEAGHAVVMHHLKHADPVHKVSIISRGLALGYTMPLPEGDRYLRSREAFEDELVSLLGGRAAEEIVFEQITTGAANDLDQATRLARTMVTRYGFSQKLGLRTFGQEQGSPYLGSFGETRDYSEAMAQTIDREIQRLLKRAYRRARTIITEHRARLAALAEALLEHETIERAQFKELMAAS